MAGWRDGGQRDGGTRSEEQRCSCEVAKPGAAAWQEPDARSAERRARDERVRQGSAEGRASATKQHRQGHTVGGVRIIESAQVADVRAGEIPDHIGVIMDGNGRWAQMRSLTRSEGHAAAEDAVVATVDSVSYTHLTLPTICSV